MVVSRGLFKYNLTLIMTVESRSKYTTAESRNIILNSNDIPNFKPGFEIYMVLMVPVLNYYFIKFFINILCSVGCQFKEKSFRF